MTSIGLVQGETRLGWTLWSPGALEPWCPGALEPWSPGALAALAALGEAEYPGTVGALIRTWQPALKHFPKPSLVQKFPRKNSSRDIND